MGKQLLQLCLWVKAELQRLSSPVLFQEAGRPWELLEVAARSGRLLNAGCRWHLESPLIGHQRAMVVAAAGQSSACPRGPRR